MRRRKLHCSLVIQPRWFSGHILLQSRDSNHRIITKKWKETNNKEDKLNWDENERWESSYQCLDHSRWWLSCVLAVCFPWPLLRFPCWHCQHRLRWPPPSPPRPWHRQKPLATRDWRPHATEKFKKNSGRKRNFAAIAVRLQWCAGSQCCVECSTWADLKPFPNELLGAGISGEDKGYWEETN